MLGLSAQRSSTRVIGVTCETCGGTKTIRLRMPLGEWLLPCPKCKRWPTPPKMLSGRTLFGIPVIDTTEDTEGEGKGDDRSAGPTGG